MGKGRGWGGPSIREGSHPPPYMTLLHDNKVLNKMLDEIDSILRRSNGDWVTTVIQIAEVFDHRPKKHFGEAANDS
jgi:hypothetical protein